MLDFLLWWNFTTPLEPILRKIAESCKVAGNARPARKIPCMFFEATPAEFLF